MSFCCCPAKAQKASPGLYISSKGLTYDPYYEKAILTTSDSLLTGKAAFIFSLAAALSTRTLPDTLQNLHLMPPNQWPPVYYYISNIHLKAEKYPILYARSNKLITEEGHRLKASVILQKIAFADTTRRVYEFELPSPAWKEGLIDTLAKCLQAL